jgi:hypothetical protein
MKIKEVCFVDNIVVDDDTKVMYRLEDSNKIITMFGWEPCEILRKDHCCNDMFNHLKKEKAWIQYISYNKTYGLPYYNLLSKKQMKKIWRYTKEMQILRFCPFCGINLIKKENSNLRAKKMEEHYERYKQEGEHFVLFWDRLRFTKDGKFFFSDKWWRT